MACEVLTIRGPRFFLHGDLGKFLRGAGVGFQPTGQPALARRGQSTLPERFVAALVRARSRDPCLGKEKRSSRSDRELPLSLYVQASGPSTNPYANQDLETVSSSTLWDLQVNYITSRTGWRRGRTTWTLGVRNLFDRAPSYRTDGLAFYSHFEDPRMRFIYLRVQQEW